MRNPFLLALLLSAAGLFAAAACNAPAKPAHVEESAAGHEAEAVVRELYRLVCVEAGGELQDWDAVRALFLPEAVIVLRDTRETTAVFSLPGFIEDFKTFDDRARVADNGFTERIVRLRSVQFGDIASVLVLYEAAVTASPRPPQQGVDSIQLVRRQGRWQIASIVNELPRTGEPIPAGLFE